MNFSFVLFAGMEIRASLPGRCGKGGRKRHESERNFRIPGSCGNGLAAIMDGDTIHGGSETYISTLADIPQDMTELSRALGKKRRFSLNGTGSSWDYSCRRCD